MISQLTALPVLMAAPADGGGAPAGSMFTTFITFGLIIAIFYLLIIRPQKKKERQTKEMISALKKGDKVATIGGIRGTVLSVKEATVVVKVDDATKIEFSKGAIANVLDSQVREPKEEAPQQNPGSSNTKKQSNKKGGGKTTTASKQPVDSLDDEDDQPEEIEKKEQQQNS